MREITLQQALIIVFAILITCAVAKLLIDRKTASDANTEEQPAEVDNSPWFVPCKGSPPSFMMAHASNTLEQRPGSKYEIDVHEEGLLPPAYVIRLLYRAGCKKHHLVMLFEHIAKQMLADGTAAASHIEFQREMVDDTMPCNLYGGFPKVIKIRRSGQVLEYTGYTDYGPLYDWIMNEQILF